jgi:hypothetical protein
MTWTKIAMQATSDRSSNLWRLPVQEYTRRCRNAERLSGPGPQLVGQFVIPHKKFVKIFYDFPFLKLVAVISNYDPNTPLSAL